MGDAADRARALADRARQKRDEHHPDHRDCPDAPFIDPEFGLVCGCGELLDEMEKVGQVAVPPSRTELEAAAAPQATQEPVDSRVRTVEGIASAVEPADPITAALTLIDPTAPYDSKMIEEHMLDALARLERGAHYQRYCEEQAVQAQLDYERAYDHALVEAYRDGGPKHVVEAKARLMAETEHTALFIAQMKAKSIERTMHSLRSALSAYQSLAKSVASAYSGYGGRQPGGDRMF